MLYMSIRRKPKIIKTKNLDDPLRGFFYDDRATGLMVGHEGYDILKYKHKNITRYFIVRLVVHSADISWQRTGVSMSFYDMHWGPFESIGQTKLFLYRLLKYHDRGYDAYK